MKEFLRKK